MKIKKMVILRIVTLGFGLIKLLKKSLDDGKFTADEQKKVIAYIAKSLGLILEKSFNTK